MHAKKCKKNVYHQFVLFIRFMLSKFKMVSFRVKKGWAKSVLYSDEYPRPFHMGFPPGPPQRRVPHLPSHPPPPKIVGLPGEPVSIATLLIRFYASTTDTSVCKDKLVPRVLSYPLCKECSNYLLILLDRNSIARIASPVPRFLLIPMPFGRWLPTQTCSCM